jgi:hypothetical protein
MAKLSEAMSARLERMAAQTMREMGRDGVRLIRQLASVRVQRSGSEVIRSEPGEPPRRDSSDLWKSIKYKLVKTNTNAVDLVFYSQDNQAKVMALEFGREGDNPMAPRPLWSVAKRIMGNTRKVFNQRMGEKLKSFRADPFSSLPSAYEE